MFEAILILTALVMFDVAALRWGRDSRDLLPPPSGRL